MMIETLIFCFVTVWNLASYIRHFQKFHKQKNDIEKQMMSVGRKQFSISFVAGLITKFEQTTVNLQLIIY